MLTNIRSRAIFSAKMVEIFTWFVLNSLGRRVETSKKKKKSRKNRREKNERIRTNYDQSENSCELLKHRRVGNVQDKKYSTKSNTFTRIRVKNAVSLRASSRKIPPNTAFDLNTP